MCKPNCKIIMTTIEQNEVIAKWLDWNNKYSEYYHPNREACEKLHIPEGDETLAAHELKFNSEFNWTMFALNKVEEELEKTYHRNYSAKEVLQVLSNYSTHEIMFTPESICEAIVNRIIK